MLSNYFKKSINMISIRSHCIPCYDELSRMQKINSFPPELDALPEKTAGEIILKFKAVVESQYFNDLPQVATITSGATMAYQWDKSEVNREFVRIWSECCVYLK